MMSDSSLRLDDRYLGIDFSGNHLQWKGGKKTSNIWIAEAVRSSPGPRLSLTDLRAVQDLGGLGSPFQRLATHLRDGRYRAAAIDAPFSIPVAFLGEPYLRMLARIGQAGTSLKDREFLEASQFVRASTGLAPPLIPCKPYRETEKYWLDRRINVRSTLWPGQRGGAAFTSACLSLLYGIHRPLWPCSAAQPGMIVEAFPAAQLWVWNLPNASYSKATAEHAKNRRTIVRALKQRLSLESYGDILRTNADALDAVLCLFAAVAAAEGTVAVPPGAAAKSEGWICVHAADQTRREGPSA